VAAPVKTVKKADGPTTQIVQQSVSKS